MTRDDVVLSAGKRLTIRFQWRDDRWTHAIEACDGDRILWRLESQQVGDDPNWPPSPALQSLQLLDVPARGNVALLLGMAGSSHWSASVEADAAGGRILFDVACRIATKPRSLGSSYLVRALADNAPRIESVELAGQEIAESSVEETAERIVVRVATKHIEPPQTVRWQYRVALGGETEG